MTQHQRCKSLFEEIILQSETLVLHLFLLQFLLNEFMEENLVILKTEVKSDWDFLKVYLHINLL